MQHFGRVAFGIDGHEQHPQLLTVIGQLVLPDHDLAQGGGADIGAMGEAEEYRRGLASHIGLGKGFALRRDQLVIALAQVGMGAGLGHAGLDQLEPGQGGNGQRHRRPKPDPQDACVAHG